MVYVDIRQFLCLCKTNDTTQKIKFSIKDLVTFTEDALNKKRHFFVQCEQIKGGRIIGGDENVS